jgi:hypothetical protein
MANSLHIPQPVALARPRGAHRFEAFSPKLARRVMFYRRPLLDQWLLLETNPKVIAFCERPGYVIVNGSRRLADFWVQYFGQQELVVLIESELDHSMIGSPCVCEDNELPIRFVAPAELAAARAWLDNWQQMLPYLVTNIGPSSASAWPPELSSISNGWCRENRLSRCCGSSAALTRSLPIGSFNR